MVAHVHSIVMLIRALASCLACLLAAGTLSAQSSAPATAVVSAMLGTGLADSELGLTVGAGAAVIASRVAARLLVDLHLVAGDDDDSSWEMGPLGPECRDDDSGEVVSHSECSITRTFAGASTDVSLLVPAGSGFVHLGGGYRVGPGSTPYGLVGYGFEPGGGRWQMLFRVTAGRGLLGFQAMTSIPIGMR